MQEENELTGFSTFGSDLKEARKAMKMSRRVLAETVGMDPRYLANIENSGFIPSLALFSELAKFCKLPIEKYFYSTSKEDTNSEQRNRVKYKVALCPEKYLSFVESVLDNAIQLEAKEAENE